MDDCSFMPEQGLTAVAIDKDKNSHNAVRWALDNLNHISSIKLIHVRNKSSLTEVSIEVTRDQADAEINQLFLPFRGICALKMIELKEIVLEGADISKAILEWIHYFNIQNIVLGISNKSLLIKKFRNPDVPSYVIKHAPDFCSVYVISKGKLSTVRLAKKPFSASANPPRQICLPTVPILLSDTEESVRAAYGQRSRRESTPPSSLHERTERRSLDIFPDYLKTPLREGPSKACSAPSGLFIEAVESSIQPRKSSEYHDSFLDTDFQIDLNFQPTDFGDPFGHSSASMENLSNPGQNRELEEEMRVLKLELKQTMEMYSNACKEAITARQKATELQQWKMDESKKIEELRHGEETALAMAEREKAKCKVAIEAAEAAQRIAELESHKRRNAEIKARREAEEKKKALNALAYKDVRYRKYTIDEIESATSNFAPERKIGEGGYGPVFKGYLDHTPVAIKVLKPDAVQGRKQFQQEVEVLSSIRHPNMVLLLGACPEYGCLVYEYMDNGSLDDRLFQRENTPPIPLHIRFRIAAEIATSLLFLHQTKPEPLVHRDLKPANILLDRNYVSKISDVGLARLVPPSMADSVTQYHMTSAAGTFCYIDPEYQQTGMLGVKSDIYSFGVLLLQIITGKPPMGLAHHVERAIEKGKLRQMLDPAIIDCPDEEAIAFAKLALKCAELRRKDRPDLGAVILPELNRLRKVGRECKTSQSQHSIGINISNVGNIPPRPYSYNIPRQTLSAQQDYEANASNKAKSTTAFDDHAKSRQ